MTKLRLGVNIDHVATLSLSWPATPVRAKRGRSVNSVRATQLGVWRDGQRMKYRPKVAEFSAVSPGWPAFAGHDTFFDVREGCAL